MAEYRCLLKLLDMKLQVDESDVLVAERLSHINRPCVCDVLQQYGYQLEGNGAIPKTPFHFGPSLIRH
jgi:hypothetical protein